ncbi:hypothetical protein [Pseudomonas synxantha]|uniref:Uncharacterized protein n=1 Tax=Pseudomonas synxantha TaxID=47883 RepID=A0ACC6JUS9_9PSED|nr:hypothetical protein [Pseudomonas synxantha]MDR6610022.1 hypothetical protein [Pseudomonas synxantha]
MIIAEQLSGTSSLNVEVANNPAVAISQFDVQFDADSAIRNKSLYGNGRMQVRVLVLISGKDKDDNVVPLPNSVLNSVFPIYYNGGQSLGGNWSVWGTENDYLHELPSNTLSKRGVLSETKTGNLNQQLPHVLEFWISSEIVGTAQIGAKVELNGETIRTNNTGANKFDSSVTLNALLPVVYPIDYFSLQTVRVENAPSLSPMNKIYLRLNPPGRSVQLRRWWERNGSAGYPGSEVFRDVKAPKIWTFFYALAHEETKTYPVPLMNGGGTFPVSVNDRRGELTLVSVLNYKTASGPKKLGVFYFSAIDEYGTEHRLSLRPIFYADNQLKDIFLDRG